jgi:hypothetical protein
VLFETVSWLPALKELQTQRPAYRGEGGAEGWWAEVIKKTAVGAGGNPQGACSSCCPFSENADTLSLRIAVNTSLPQMVSQLMARFSSREGYQLFDDVVPARTIASTLLA